MPRPAAVPADQPDPATGRPGLRGQPAGHDLNRLPLAVPPVAGEQAAGWLSRVAHRYGLSPHALLTAIGAPTPSYSVRAVARHLHRHTEQVTALLGAAPPGRSPAGSFLDGALAGYQHTYCGGVGRWPSGSRFCPGCLTGTADGANEADAADAADGPGVDRAAGVVGVWSASWSSPLQAVCLTHRVLLVACCPGCGQVPWSSSAWTAHPGPDWSCREHLPVPRRRPGQPTAGAAVKGARRAWCGYDLRTASAPAATDRHLQVQQHLDAAARQAGVDPDGPVTTCGTGTTRLEYLHALLELVTEHRGSVAGLWRLGTDPRLLLDSLDVAVAVLTEPDPTGAVAVAGRHGLLNPLGRCTPIGPDSVLRRRRHNGLLGALRLGVANDAGGLSPSAQLTFRVGSGRPRYPEPGLQCGLQDGPLRGGQLPLRVIPQVLWPGLLTDHLAAAAGLGDAGGSDPAGAMVVARACAAMSLARLGSTRPWRLIALELGLPAWLADQPAALHRELVEQGRWSAFLSDLDRLGAALENEMPPMDYRARRQLSADPQRLLAAVRAGRLLADDVPSDAVSDQLLARLFWQTYTGGDLRLAPAPLGWSDPAAAVAGQHRVKQLRTAATGTLLVTQAVLETCGQVGATGPLVWGPPSAGSAVLDGALATMWSRPVEQDQDCSDGDDGIALSAALAAAEEDLTEHAFQPWLWDWLDINYAICNTDDNASWPPAVRALRIALTDPDTDPAVVRHPALAAALRHTTRTHDGVQRWQLLRHSADADAEHHQGRPSDAEPGVTAVRPAAG